MTCLGEKHVRTWLAVVLAAADTDAAQVRMRGLRRWADAVELRLDLMDTFHLPSLLADTPMPTIVTCRPTREGGEYVGLEQWRLDVLREAAATGATAVDVEWDAAEALGPLDGARRIISRHLFDHTPLDLDSLWDDLAARGADVVKLATHAHTLEDTLRVCALCSRATRPTIAIAMGPVGLLSRLLAPTFPQAFLTYGAASAREAVAPGQIAVQEMRERYFLHLVSPRTRVYGYLAPSANSVPLLARVNRAWREGGHDALLLPLQPTAADTLSEVVARAWDLGFRGIWVDGGLAPAVLRTELAQAVWLRRQGNRVQVAHPHAPPLPWLLSLVEARREAPD